VSVTTKFDALVATLTSVTPEVEVLIEAGRSLAWEIDTAAMDNEDPKVKPRSAAAPVTALRALMADLLAKGSASGSSDGEAEGEGDWTKPAAVADLAPVRDAKRSRSGNARSRGRGGGSAAG
jgi:hypothetical protein